MRKIFAILGKASVGKDSLVSYLSEETGYPIALSFTTRPMRKNEVQGREYDFISKEKFDWLSENNHLVEYTEYTVANGETWYYGLTREQLEQSEYVLAIVNPHGFRQLKEVYGDKVCSIQIDADAKTRIMRYLDRDETYESKAEECCRRFLADQRDFKDLVTDFIVYNDTTLKEGLEGLHNIVKMVVAKDILDRVGQEFKNNPRKFINAND